LQASLGIIFCDDETKPVELKVYATDYRAKLSSIFELDGRVGTNELKALYEIPPKALKRVVKRNTDRFPDDFMLVLDEEELADWRRQFGTSNADRMGLHYPPMVFTEQGVAMLSSVLNSPRMVKFNIDIMRTFVRLRHILASHADLARKLEELERKYDEQFSVVFDALRELMNPAARSERVAADCLTLAEEWRRSCTGVTH